MLINYRIKKTLKYILMFLFAYLICSYNFPKNENIYIAAVMISCIFVILDILFPVAKI